MKKAFLYLITLLIFTIPVRCFALLFLLALLVLVRQTVEKPAIMDSWKGFFQPQIQINSHIVGGGSTTLAVGDCAFILPTKVKAYNACCDASATRRASKEVSTGGTFIKCKDNSSSCVCAKRVLGCQIDLHPNPEIGCVIVPLGPPPPPFYDHFQQLPEVKIVPMLNSSFFAPKIKVMVGLGNQKRCSDGATIDLSANCADGSEGTLSGYSSRVLRLNSDGSSQGIIGLFYNSKSYRFEAKKRVNQICGLYYGNDAATNPISSVCYDVPEAKKPEIVSSPLNIDSLLKNGSSITVNVSVDGYNNNLPFALYYNGGGILHNDTKLRLKRPKIGDDHFFEAEILCYNASGGSVVGSILSGKISCPSSYDQGAKIAYKEDPNGKILCISEEEGINEYILARGNKIFKIAEFGKAFIPHRYSSSTNEWLVDYSVHQSHMRIEDTRQATLDKIKNIGANLFSVYPQDNSGYYAARYKKLESVANDATTSFINVEDNRAFFLTTDEASGAKYLPIDPYLRGLCITNFPHRDYSTIITEEFFDADFDKCDFVTVEAWGSGAASHIFTDLSDPLISRHGKSFSGASGGYTKGTVKINGDKNTLKIKIGKGGVNSNEAGETTTVHLCDSSKSNCTVLLSASGGKQFRETAPAIDFNNSAIFDKDSMLHADNLSGQGGSYETVSKPNPDVPEPIMLDNGAKGKYVDWTDTLCKSSIALLAHPSTVAGMGGCVSRTDNVLQSGANGHVKIICEKWKN